MRGSRRSVTKSTLADTARSLKHRAVDGLARASAAGANLFRHGNRTVIMPPQGGVRFGNLLYLWLHAHLRSSVGDPTVVRWVPSMDPWLDVFPELRTLTVLPDRIRFSDRRAWDSAWLYQRYGVDFGPADLESFIRHAIARHIVLLDPDAVVVNVRRGDYYTHFAEKYSFDQAGYVGAAMEVMGDAERIVVVSDDKEWCLENIGPVVERPTATVRYADPDPVANFLTLAGSRRIIGTNSTFTYWAAYVAGVLRSDVEIVMPSFHARLAHGTTAHQLDPRWTTIDGFH